MSTFNATDGRKKFFDLIDRAHHQERIANERHVIRSVKIIKITSGRLRQRQGKIEKAQQC